MQKIKLSQSGAARVVLILVVLVFLAALGFGGWWLWKRNAPQRVEEKPQETTQTQEPTPQEQIEPQTTEASPASSVYTVSIPEAWQQQQCPADNPDILFVAPEQDLLGRCGSEFFGLVAISRTEGDRREDESAYTGRSDINTVSYDELSVAGMEAIRVEYMQEQEPIVGPPVGTRFIEVIAYDGTNSYSLMYTQQPGWDDYRAEFDAIISSLAVN